jgi:hypothetical protein
VVIILLEIVFGRRGRTDLCKILQMGLKEADLGVDDNIRSSHQVTKEDRRFHWLETTAAIGIPLIQVHYSHRLNMEVD